MLNDKPILVTGCAGYIGSICCKILLERGFEVVGLDNLSTGFRKNVPEGVVFCEGDIADEHLVRELVTKTQVQACLHFAAYIEVGESVKKPEKYFENNYEKTKSFVNTLYKHGVRKLIYSSTAAVYGTPNHGLITEESKLEPINPYGESKLRSERFLREFAANSDFRYIALRYFNVAGAYAELGECHEPETHLIPLTLDAALGRRDGIKIFGTDYPTDDGTAVRDYIHVRDLIAAHILALTNLDAISNRAFNLGYGHGYSVREIINAVKEVTKIDFKVVEDERRAGDPPMLVANPGAIKALGFDPLYDDLKIIVSDAYKHRSLI